MTRRKKSSAGIGILLALLLYPLGGFADNGSVIKVVDYFTGEPIPGARVTLNDEFVLTDQQNMFPVPKPGSRLKVRAQGYMRADQVIPASSLPAPATIKLMPLQPKALYLSFYGIGDRSIRASAIKLIEETELNSLVIDVKGDRAMIPYRSSIPLAKETGAQRINTVRDVHGLIKNLKEKGIYTIARIVVFKDDLLAQARPDLAVKNERGEIWRDRENLAWLDPFKKEVWDYNIQIAVEAAQIGFDEIQFDYVRFPDASAPRFSMPNTEENRVKAVTGFLMEAKNKLMPYNVFLAADIFGYVCWNYNDTNIGQKLEALVSHVDYLSPMLYPSGFQFGIPGYRKPIANPYEIVYLSLKKAQERTQVPSTRFRPWLQAFRDYAFDRRIFNGKEIRDQINASSKFGSQGWMLWNPGNKYSSHGLRSEEPLEWITSLVPFPKS
ncbi:MAG: putative glycoside hydrolase [Deltaproteobacteria bacterium]|nr:putative glycoside hydrolase [Deltaproteobacteria bacterium]